MLKRFSFAIICLFGASLYAQPAKPANQTDAERIAELERRMEILAEEIEKDRDTSGIYAAPPTSGKYGLSPAASKVYDNKGGLSIGGYGELVGSIYRPERANGQPAPASEFANTANLQRFVVYLGYKFSDRIILNTELEYENANTSSMEFAYFDFLFRKEFNLRAGLLLVPMGLVNEKHEPVTFLGVNRPETELFIIPSTWREMGAGLFGGWRNFEYRLYGVSSLRGERFNDSQGIRPGRQGGNRAVIEDVAVTGRLDYFMGLAFFIGTAGFFGRTGQTAQFTAETSILDIHTEFQYSGIRLRALGAIANVGDAALINQNRLITSGDLSTGSQMRGGYLEAGYDILRLLSNTTHNLYTFARYENIDLQYQVPAGFERSVGNRREIYTTGIDWFPHPLLTIKLDHQWYVLEDESGVHRVNFGIGFIF